MSIHLFKHNQEAYNSVTAMLEREKMAAVIHPTGTGKSLIAFKLAEEHPSEKFLWLSPSEYIYQTQLENLGMEFDNIQFMSYSRLMKNEDSIETLHPDYIILDEFHRCGAAEWGKSVRKLLTACPDAKRLGLSATNIRSPGPIFFAQERIGRNGRKFKMYKFRSMYMDAEERKKELMAQNKISDGLMFKMDFDPRIIGNKILPDGTRKTGIGQFIRKTSLDEFPQFINILLGDMSLVGTRPPTVDEWELYEPHHRARMSFRPGLTGMWQVSGRSNITDFEEVVKLDTQYISEWSLRLDVKILWQTVWSVFKSDGAM